MENVYTMHWAVGSTAVVGILLVAAAAVVDSDVLIVTVVVVVVMVVAADCVPLELKRFYFEMRNSSFFSSF